jgi:outer membrane protein TolC
MSTAALRSSPPPATRWRSGLAVAATVMVAAGGPALAQAPPNPSVLPRPPAPVEANPLAAKPAAARPRVRVLSLEDAVRLALAQHPQTRAARIRIKSAQARVGQARAAYYPQVNVWLEYIRATEAGSATIFVSFPGLARVGGSNPTGVRNYDNFNNYLAALLVNQLIYDFGRTAGAVASQEALVKSTRLNEQLVALNIAFTASQAYYAVLAGREQVRVGEEALVRTTRILDFAQAGQRAGLRPPNEVARAEADVANARLALIRARANLDLSRAQLAQAVGNASLEVDVAPSTAPTGGAPTEHEALSAAIGRRPELQALAAQAESLRGQLRSARGGHLPRLEAIGGFNVRGQFAVPAPLKSIDAPNWYAALVLNFPIFQGFFVKERENELTADMRALRASVDDVRQTIALEVKQALLNIAAAEEAQVAAQKSVDAAKLALEISEGRYRTGLGTIVEVTDAQATYIAAQSAGVRAVYDARWARAVLSRATGTIVPAATGGAP